MSSAFCCQKYEDELLDENCAETDVGGGTASNVYNQYPLC